MESRLVETGEFQLPFDVLRIKENKKIKKIKENKIIRIKPNSNNRT